MQKRFKLFDSVKVLGICIWDVAQLFTYALRESSAFVTSSKVWRPFVKEFVIAITHLLYFPPSSLSKLLTAKRVNLIYIDDIDRIVSGELFQEPMYWESACQPRYSCHPCFLGQRQNIKRENLTYQEIYSITALQRLICTHLSYSKCCRVMWDGFQ